MKTTKLVKLGIYSKQAKLFETLWAKKLGGNRFRLMNTPFFSYNISWGDTVLAKPDADGFFVFDRVIKKSGWRTILIILKNYSITSKRAKPLRLLFERMGCGHEGFDAKALAINVPPKSPLNEITTFLATRRIQWEITDPCREKRTSRNSKTTRRIPLK
jgi:hypothetical protein